MDETEEYRRARVAELNAAAAQKQELEKQYGRVWTTAQLTEDFDVLGFMAPFVVVRHKKTGEKGSLEFQHSPRFYFNFKGE